MRPPSRLALVRTEQACVLVTVYLSLQLGIDTERSYLWHKRKNELEDLQHFANY